MDKPVDSVSRLQGSALYQVQARLGLVPYCEFESATNRPSESTVQISHLAIVVATKFEALQAKHNRRKARA